jgi:hypothetical protein
MNMNRLSCGYLLSDITLLCSNRSAKWLNCIYWRRWLAGNGSFISRDCLRRKSLKNRPVDAGYDAGCIRYTLLSKFIYLPKSLRPLKTDVIEGSCVWNHSWLFTAIAHTIMHFFPIVQLGYTVFNSTDSTAKLRKLKVISHISQNLLQGRKLFPAKFKYWSANDNAGVLTEPENYVPSSPHFGCWV